MIGRRLHVPVVSKTPEEAPEHFGWLAPFVALDISASSVQTQKQLDWHPQETDLLSDMRDGAYFS